MEFISDDKVGYQSEPNPARLLQLVKDPARFDWKGILDQCQQSGKTRPARTVARVTQQGQQHTADTLVRALTLLASTSHAPTLED